MMSIPWKSLFQHPARRHAVAWRSDAGARSSVSRLFASLRPALQAYGPDTDSARAVTAAMATAHDPTTLVVLNAAVAPRREQLNASSFGRWGRISSSWSRLNNCIEPF